MGMRVPRTSTHDKICKAKSNICVANQSVSRALSKHHLTWCETHVSSIAAKDRIQVVTLRAGGMFSYSRMLCWLACVWLVEVTSELRLGAATISTTNILYGGKYTMWPNNWMVIRGLNDPVDTGVIPRLDFVGDTNSPCGFWATNSAYLFFRMQVHTPTVTNTTYSDNLWIYIDRTGYNYGGNQTGQPDYAITWDTQQGHGMEFQVWSINGTTWSQVRTDDIDGNPGQKVTPPDLNTNGNAYLRSIDGLVTTQLGTNSYLDWAISWDYLTNHSTLAQGQDWRIQFAGRANANDHGTPDADIAGGFSISSSTTNSWSPTIQEAIIPEPRSSLTTLVALVVIVRNLMRKRRSTQ